MQTLITSPEKLSNNHDINALHHQFMTYGKNSRHWLQQCARLLPDIERKKVWKKKGYGSIHEYAGKLAGMSHSLVDEALRVLKHVAILPELKKVLEEKGIGAVRPVVAIATPETDVFWAEKARVMSVHTLAAYVREAKKQNLFMADDANPANLMMEQLLVSVRDPVKNEAEILHVEDFEAKNRLPITMHLSSELAKKLTKLKGQDNWENLLADLLTYRKQVLQDKQPEPVETTSRHIPAEIEHFIIERSRGICEFSSCTKPYDIIHHTQRFALEQIHDPTQMVALCTTHERLAHLGLVENEQELPQNWQVRKEPDRGEINSTQRAKYNIDQMVQGYRKPG